MKLIVSVALAGLLFTSCGKKEAPKPVTAKPAPEKKAQPPAPQGKLPVMNPEKAKFIAVPNTPKDPEPRKDEKPAVETRK